VHLGENVSIWFGAVIRADNTRITVGARSNIQEQAVLHSDEGIPCTVGEGVTVRASCHAARLHYRK
jgi:carbonic anhydrase/acetyltransferase-like protein (isoleucine patch superfamily)